MAASVDAALRAVGALADEAIDLAGTALLLAARDRPGVDLDRYRRHLEELGAATAAAGGDRVAALAEVLGEHYGYHGDDETYDDLDNADLTRVIDRRKGIPVSLGILYLHVGRSLGWPVTGLNFPGHFLIRVDEDGGRAIVDPFNRGRRQTPEGMRSLLKTVAGTEVELAPGHYAPVGSRAVLIRLQNNIKIRSLDADDHARALRALDSILLIAPDYLPAWREIGLLHAHLGNLGNAVAALETFVARSPEGEGRHEGAALIERLRRMIN